MQWNSEDLAEHTQGTPFFNFPLFTILIIWFVKLTYRLGEGFSTQPIWGGANHASFPPKATGLPDAFTDASFEQ
jgi:hypothetical protein